MVARDGRVKLVDFGLAKLVPRLGSGEDDATRTALSSGTHTVEGKILGTVSYMSPEQAEGKKVDARSDVFSFGTLLYEMLTGERAFRGDSALSTLSAILTLEPRPLRSLAPTLPPEIERVIARCIRKDPDERWQNMTDIRAALAELREEAESRTLIADAQPRPRGGGDAKWPLLAGAAVGLVLVLAGAWWLTRGMATEQPAPRPSAEEALADASGGSVPGAPSATEAGAAADGGADRPSAPGCAGDGAGHGRNPGGTAQAPPKTRERAPAPAAPAAAPSPAPPPPAPEPSRVVLPEGARIVVALASDVRSSAVKPGDRVALVVGDDVLVDGAVVVRKGTPATGEIIDVQRRNVFGGGGRLVMTVLWTTAVDGQEVRLRPVPKRGAGKKADGISLVPARSDKAEKADRDEEKREIVAPAGATYNAWVDSSKEIAAPR